MRPTVCLPVSPLLAGIKHLCRLEQVMAKMEAHEKGFVEGLLFDHQGHLIEGIASNVFLVKSGTLLTPSLEGAGVAGVMREWILGWATSAGRAVGECVLTDSDLDVAEEVFLCNSLIGVWPVSRFGDRCWDRREYSAGVQNALLQQFAWSNLV